MRVASHPQHTEGERQDADEPEDPFARTVVWARASWQQMMAFPEQQPLVHADAEIRQRAQCGTPHRTLPDPPLNAWG